MPPGSGAWRSSYTKIVWCSFLWSVEWMIHLNCFLGCSSISGICTYGCVLSCEVWTEWFILTVFFFWVFFHNWNFYLWHRLRSSLTPPPCRGFAPQPRSGCRTPQACIKSIKVKTSQWPGRLDLESWSFLLNFYSLNWTCTTEPAKPKAIVPSPRLQESSRRHLQIKSTRMGHNPRP